MDDYTKFPIGQKVDRGEIQICPHCGRRGVAETVNGMTFFTHSQWARINDKEPKYEIGWDMCPKSDVALGPAPAEDL